MALRAGNGGRDTLERARRPFLHCADYELIHLPDRDLAVLVTMQEADTTVRT